MSSKEQVHSDDKTTAKPRSSRREVQNPEKLTKQTHPATIIRGARVAPSSLTSRDVLQLQRTIGNQAVSRLLAGAGRGHPTVQRAREENDEIQTKPLGAATKPPVQRQDLEEEELQMKPDIQQVGLEGGEVDPDVEVAINQARGGGQPLEEAVQKQMSETIDHDFSRVRVHRDSGADELNQQLSAKTFTTGPDIFFKRGAYDPVSSRGRELIAHELTHVVQQGTGRVSGHGSGMTVRPAGDTLEKEADAQARRASSDENKRQRGLGARAHKIARRAAAHPAMTDNRGRIVQRVSVETARTEPSKRKEDYRKDIYGWTIPERIIPRITIEAKGSKWIPKVEKLSGEISLQTKPPPEGITYITEGDATPDKSGKMVEDLKKLGEGKGVKYYAEAAVTAHEEVHASSDKDVLSKNASTYEKKYLQRLKDGLKGKSKGDKAALEKEAEKLMQKESKATPDVRYSPHKEWYNACQKQGKKDHDTPGGSIAGVERPIVEEIIKAIEGTYKGAERVSGGMTEVKEGEEPASKGTLR